MNKRWRGGGGVCRGGGEVGPFLERRGGFGQHEQLSCCMLRRLRKEGILGILDQRAGWEACKRLLKKIEDRGRDAREKKRR